MIRDVLRDAEQRMQSTLEVFRRELAGVRAGRATPALLDKVKVDYYGTQVPVSQLATVTAPEPRLLVIQPWDRNALPEIERAISKSDLGLVPQSDGRVIRITIPQLTEERRQELVKQVRRLAEQERVAIRNVRRDALEQVRAWEREGAISEDEARRAVDEIQRLTDRYVELIDQALAAKEKEILEV